MKRIQVASKSKRILSSLIDLAIISGLFCLFYFLVFSKAVAAVQNFESKNQTILVEKRKSNLYIEDGSKTILENNPNINYKDLEQQTYKYYTDYLKSYVKEENKYTKYWYGVSVLHLKDELGLVEGETEYSDDKVLYKWTKIDKDDPQYEEKGGSFVESDYIEFTKNNFGSAVYNFTMNDITPVKKAVQDISFGTVRALLYSSIVATIIPCFVVPICLKNGKTVGKLITKLVVLTDEGYEYKRYKHIFRYLSFYIVEVFGGVVTIGLTIILSTSLVLFSKKRRALHDYISFSVVADEVHSVFYKDEDEENNFKEKSVTSLTLEQ